MRRIDKEIKSVRHKLNQLKFPDCKIRKSLNNKLKLLEKIKDKLFLEMFS